MLTSGYLAQNLLYRLFNMTAVDRIYKELKDSSDILLQKGELSLSIALDGNLRKILLLGAASHFEHRLCGIVKEFVSKVSGDHVLIVSLVQNKAIHRQYHTWFKWDSGNANSFYALFGEEFKRHMKEKGRKDDQFSAQAIAFIEIGNLRNQMVHKDYATFPIEKTPEEIYEKFKLGDRFVDVVASELMEFRPDIE